MPYGFRVLLLAVVVLALGAPTASAQNAERRALDYLAANASRHALSTADAAAAEVISTAPGLRGKATHVYLTQRHNGLEVVPARMTVSILEDGRVLSAMGGLESALALRAPSPVPSISAADAVRALAFSAGLQPTAPLSVAAQKSGSEVMLTGGGMSPYLIPAQLVYAADERGDLVLAWETSIYQNDHQHDWAGFVDAATGRVFGVQDRVVHDTFGPAEGTHAHEVRQPAAEHVAAVAPMLPRADAAAGGAAYRVYEMPVESPYFSTPAAPQDGRTLASGVEDLEASPFGWHDTDGAAGAEYTTSRGNNVFAYPDTDDNNSPDSDGIPDGGAALQFDFPVDFAQQPSAYKEAAVTNLFYWNNLIHDILWQYGFDEASGNFQVNNYGRGGNDFDDAVFAEAQDGGGTNNANFWTPTDLGGGALGPRPRMQMYRGANTSPNTDGDLDNLVIVHEYGHGISIRLTGGALDVDCLRNSEQMGEGWSDWYGALLTIEPGDTGADRRGVGTYLFGQGATGNGIRPAPYSTDFAINDYTYGRTTGGLSVPHGIGFVWATALWELTWDLIDAFGFDPDVHNADGTAGNQKVMALVTEALKIQPCSPGFVDGRDAILAADEALYGGAHTDMIWAAFARRGLGALANQGSSDSNSDNVESFVEPEQNPPAAVTDLSVVPDGDAAALLFTATGDDGTSGTAAAYDIRVADAPITSDAEFDAATQLATDAVPQEAGMPEAVRVEGLDFETTYHFALKVRDESFNVSPLSNSAEGTTLAAPIATLPAGSIDAYLAEGQTQLTARIRNDGPSSLSYSLGLREAPTTLGRRAATASAKASAPAARAFAPTPEVKGALQPGGVAQRSGSGGPDAFGYRWVDSNEPSGPVYDWADISGSGTALSLGDDDSQTVTLPGPFPFYGTDRTSVTISSNGYLTFGTDGTDYTNDPIPDADDPNAIIALFWDDLNPSAGGTVYHETLADGRFVVQYEGVSPYSGSGTVTAQAILQPGGAIVLQYQDVSMTTSSATIGIENDDASDGLQVVNNADYVENGLAVRIAALFVDAAPSAGLVPAGGSADVVLTFDATGLAEGVYNAEMTVFTNDPAAPETVIPVSMTVGSDASANLSTNALDIDVVAGETADGTVTLSNPGGADLTWALDGPPGGYPAWMDVDVTGGSLAPGEAQVITFTVDASNHDADDVEVAMLSLQSNDPNNPSLALEVTMRVMPPVAGEDAASEIYTLGQPYPNPSQGSARVDLEVADAQIVIAELYDTLGRRVATVHDGPVAAGARVTMELRDGSLAAGTYVLRVAGETFADARRLTVSR